MPVKAQPDPIAARLIAEGNRDRVEFDRRRVEALDATHTGQLALQRLRDLLRVFDHLPASDQTAMAELLLGSWSQSGSRIRELLNEFCRRPVSLAGNQPHERRCHDCGNVAIHADRVAPEVWCKKCGSRDTRWTRKAVAP